MTHRQRITWLFVVFVALFLVAYGMYWKAKADLLKISFTTEKVVAAREGKTFRGEMEVYGFPLSFTARIKNLFYKDPTRISFSAREIKLDNYIWAPLTTNVSLAGPFSLHLHAQEVQLSGDTFTLVYAPPLWMPPKSMSDGPRIRMAIKGLKFAGNFPPSLRGAIEDFSIRGRFKGMLPNAQRDTVEAWRKAGGIIQIETLEGTWGPLNINAEGTMGLDDSLQPIASFSSQLKGHDVVLDELSKGGQLKPLTVGLIQTAFKYLENKEAPGTAQVPLTIHNNELIAAGVKVYSWSPLHF
jgi:hypothetical protein